MAALAIAGAISASAAAQNATYSIDLDGLEYRKNARFPGVETTVIFGDRRAPGLYTTHARLEAGARIPPHTHPNTITTWVTSGTAYIGTGDVFDESLLKAYPAGTFFVTPAGSPHFIYAKDGPFSILDHGSGPTAFTVLPSE